MAENAEATRSSYESDRDLTNARICGTGVGIFSVMSFLRLNGIRPIGRAKAHLFHIDEPDPTALSSARSYLQTHVGDTSQTAVNYQSLIDQKANFDRFMLGYEMSDPLVSTMLGVSLILVSSAMLFLGRLSRH